MTVPVFHQNRYALALTELVREGCSWLDLGAGTKLHDGWLGASCDELAGRAGYLAGCDVVEDVMHNPLLHDARVADAGALPWSDCRFDVVSANMVVEHLEQPAEVFKEVYRVLRPGGCFVFITPNRAHPVIGAAALLLPGAVRRWYGIHVEGRRPGDVFVTSYRCNTVRAIARTASAAGFRAERIEAFVSDAPLLPGSLGTLEARIGRVAARTRLGRALGADILAILRRPA